MKCEIHGGCRLCKSKALGTKTLVVLFVICIAGMMFLQ